MTVGWWRGEWPAFVSVAEAAQDRYKRTAPRPGAFDECFGRHEPRGRNRWSAAGAGQGGRQDDG